MKTDTTPGVHQDFKIISMGRELPFPMLRLIGALILTFILGMCVGSDVFRPLVTEAVNAMVCR